VQEHPVPQDITGYQFHIVGNMTLKQFFEVGAGCIIAFLIYTTNLLPFIKWPFMFLFVGLGVMAAFVPFEERPFDHWIITFFRSLYQPTKFFWKKSPRIPDPFLYESNNNQPLLPELDLSPARRKRIKDFLSSLQEVELNPYEAYEANRIQTILGSFTQVQVTETEVVAELHRPNLSAGPREMLIYEVSEQPIADPSQQVDEKAQIAVSDAAAEIAIPETEATVIEVTADPAAAELAPETAPAAETSPELQYLDSSQTYAQQLDVTSLGATQFNTNLPFPELPTEPNKPVGMVLGPNNELIAEAIVEISTDTGQVVRAVRSNTLGQFFISTPLPRGNYQVTIEKTGLQFQPQVLNLTNELVPPIEARAISS
jgi:hypothetical protein